MILIALLIHLLGHYLPVWPTKVKLREFRSQFTWKQILIELAGTFANFIIAFIIILIVTLSGSEKYLLNKNAIYGINCSEEAKRIGFRDGDKVNTINNHPVIKFSDILKNIISEPGSSQVDVIRGDSDIVIDVSEQEKMALMKGESNLHFSPKIMPDSSIKAIPKQLEYTESQKELKDVFATFKLSIKMISSYIFRENANVKGIGGFIAITGVESLRGLFFLLALCSIFIGLLNLLPIPGFDVGNALIALIEKTRKRKFNVRVTRIIRFVCIGVVALYFIVMIYSL
jgi:membrane-associated protease RseP (regulator of RpoE activity)